MAIYSTPGTDSTSMGVARRPRRQPQPGDSQLTTAGQPPPGAGETSFPEGTGHPPTNDWPMPQNTPQAAPAPPRSQRPFRGTPTSPVQSNGLLAPASPTGTATQGSGNPVEPGIDLSSPGGSQPYANAGVGPVPTYQGGQLTSRSLPQYQPYQLNQYQAADMNPQMNAQNALLMQVLGSPESMNPLVVNQLKEQGKESALDMQRQQMDQLGSSMAARGLTNSGVYDANTLNIGDATRQQILGNNRAVDIAAAQTNLQDRLNALNAATGVMQGQTGINQGNFGQTLAGQTAQAGQNQQGYQSRVAQTQYDLALQQAQQALNQQAAQSGQSAFTLAQNADLAKKQLALQQALGLGQQNINQAQFGANNELNWAQLMNQSLLGQGQLGLGWTQANNNMIQALLPYLMGGG